MREKAILCIAIQQDITRDYGLYAGLKKRKFRDTGVPFSYAFHGNVRMLTVLHQYVPPTPGGFVPTLLNHSLPFLVVLLSPSKVTNVTWEINCTVKVL